LAWRRPCYLIAGRDSASYTDVDRYDPRRRRWERLPDLRTARTSRWPSLPDLRTPRHGSADIAREPGLRLVGGVVPGLSTSSAIEFLDVRPLRR
jgi:hypothetical protein